MRRAFKLIVINIAICLGLLAAINVLVGAAVDIREWQQHSVASAPQIDARASLPPFKSREQAAQLYREISELKSTYKPFVGWRRKPYSGKATTIDADGFRIVPGNKPAPGSKLALLLGGSTMWGTGAIDTETIAADLQKDAPTYFVMNHGETGYNTRQSFEDLLNALAAGVRPDFVFLYFGANDVATLCRIDATSVNSTVQETIFRERIDNRSKPEPKTYALKRVAYELFLRNSYEYIVRIVNRRAAVQQAAAPAAVYDCDEKPEKVVRVVAAIMTSVRAAHAVSSDSGFKFMAALEPIAYVGHPDVNYLKLDSHMGDQYRAVYPLLREKIARERQGWLQDWTDAFDRAGPVYVDYAHFAAIGHKIIAERIVKAMQTLQDK